ncbi:hypothetical protein [Nocardioides ultimimeridianus]
MVLLGRASITNQTTATNPAGGYCHLAVDGVEVESSGIPFNKPTGVSWSSADLQGVAAVTPGAHTFSVQCNDQGSASYHYVALTALLVSDG